MEGTQSLALIGMPAMSLSQAFERRMALVKFCQGIMKEGIDYGTIPGTNKPTLLKPGAEKLTTFFGLTVRFMSIECVDDWTGENHGGEPFFSDWYRCQLWKGDMLIAEADGECNSRESKYRWRWVAEEDIPLGLDKANLKKRSGSRREMKFAVEKAETSGKYGKPAEYWQEFKDAIADGTAEVVQIKARSNKVYEGYEIDSTVYRVPNEDIASQRNTIKKMSQKRAMVGATLIAINASEFYTQDMEDMAADLGVTIEGRVVSTEPVPESKSTDSGPPGEPPWAEGMRQAPSAQPPESAKPESHWMEDSAKQVRFWANANEAGLDRDVVHHEWGVESMKDTTLSFEQSLALLKVAHIGLQELGVGLMGIYQALDIGRLTDLIGCGKKPPQIEAELRAWVSKQAETAPPVAAGEQPRLDEYEEIPY